MLCFSVLGEWQEGSSGGEPFEICALSAGRNKATGPVREGRFVHLGPGEA